MDELNLQEEKVEETEELENWKFLEEQKNEKITQKAAFFLHR